MKQNAQNFLFNWENNLPVTHYSICLRHFLLEVQQKETGSGDFPQASPTELIVLVREKEGWLQIELESKLKSQTESNCSKN